MTNLIDAAATERAAEYRVQAALNAFVRRRSTIAQLLEQIESVCQLQSDAAWQALALLDQLHRRRAIDLETYRLVKVKLNDIVFSSTGKYVTIPPTHPGEGPELRNITTNASSPALSVTQGSANATSFSPPQAGMLLANRYRIAEPLFVGRTSVTFKAYDERRKQSPETEQCVAIRWLDERFQTDPHAITAVQNEYSRLQAIAHPSVPKVFEIQTVVGATFIVMELPRGELLTRLVQRSQHRRLPLPLASTLVREIGFVLASAHDRGIVHGGLHLNDVLITTTGELRVYGLAQSDTWLSGPTPASSTATDSIAIRGQSPYRLRATAAARNDDLYALACIAYELLCGEIDGDLHDDASRSKFAPHLNNRQWQTLQRGLSCVGSGLCEDVREWLRALDLKQAWWRLPALNVIETQIADVKHSPSRSLSTANLPASLRGFFGR